METDFVGLVKFALKIHVRMGLWQLVLDGDEVGVEVVDTKRCLELIVGCISSGFMVDSESLMNNSAFCLRGDP